MPKASLANDTAFVNLVKTGRPPTTCLDHQYHRKTFMKYQWYLVDTDPDSDTPVKGSNDKEAIVAYLEDPRYVVINAAKGEYFKGDTQEDLVTDLALSNTPAYDGPDNPVCTDAKSL